MSLKSFIAGIWSAIKGLFHNLAEEEKKLLPIVIGIIQNIKVVADSPVADVISALIPGDVDDKIRAKLQEFLPKILMQLNMLNTCQSLQDPNEQLQCILTNLKLSSDDAKNIYYHGLASLILTELSDGKLSWSDCTAIAEYYYKNIWKQEHAA
jgi:hypothetical protein